ncbi:MAG: putative glycoside hydrolase [Anaerolineae bacterium]
MAWIATALLAGTVLIAGCGIGLPTLSGHVLDAESGHPIASAVIRAADKTTRTNETGTFAMRLPQGTHELAVYAPGYQRQTLTATVPLENPTDALEVPLNRRQLRGLVVDQDGNPMAGALATMATSNAESGDDGTFTLDATELTTLTVTSDCYLPAKIGPAEIEGLFDGAGTQIAELNTALNSRIVTGVVTDQFSGEPIPNVAVHLGDQTAQTGPDGRYALLACPPADEMRFNAATHRPVEGITYDGQTEQDISLEPWWTLLEVVDAKSGEGLAGVRVEADTGVIETEADGKIAVMVLPGTQLTFERFGYHSTTLNYQGEECLQIALQPVGLAGRLLDGGTGLPVTRATIQAFEPGSDEPILCETDEQGRFLLEEPQEIETVRVKAPGYRLAMMSLEGSPVVEIHLEPFVAKGIYITFGRLADPAQLEALLQLVEDTELNTVVIDVKNDRSWLAWPSKVPLAQETNGYQENVMDLHEVVRMCHERDIYVIARMVIFKDDLLAETRPDWAAKWANGTLYHDFEGLAWMDPFRQEVRDYNLALTMEVAATGVDEIQYDYVRFASDGVRGVVYSQDDDADSRTATIVEMVRQAHEALASTPVFFSIDVFGMIPWYEPPWDDGIGQRLAEIAEHVDYISPMLYPTTFTRGNLGYDAPGNYPYEIVYRSVLQCRERTDTLVRPWLQAYSIGPYQYGPVEQLLQIRAAEEAGSTGWLFWHAGTAYDPDVFAPDAWERYPAAGGPPAAPTD